MTIFFFKKIIAIVAVTAVIFPVGLFGASATATDSFKVFLTVDQETAPGTTGGGGGGVGTQFPIITNVVVTPSINGAVITYKTAIPATTTLSYGKSTSFEIGTIGDPTLSESHIANISDLTPNTTYYFSIDAKSFSGSLANSGTISFNTLPVGPVVNALSFSATAREKDIELNWRLPVELKNSTVRIVRSETFYPVDVEDGKTIFENAGQNQFVDSDVVAQVRYYYTLFIKGDDGKYSSGAVADAKIPLPGEKEETQADLFDRLSKAPFVDERISSLSISDFIFSQPDREDFSSKGDETLFIEGDKNLTIKLSYARVPELLKTIAITLSDPDEKSRKFTFLLRVDEDKTFYTATIAPLGRSGEYKMDVAIVDYKNQGLKKISANLLAVVSRPFVTEGVFVPPVGFTVNDLVMLLVVVLALFALSYMSVRRIDLSYLRGVWSRYRPARRRR